jgi:hypothetical protein
MCKTVYFWSNRRTIFYAALPKLHLLDRQAPLEIYFPAGYSGVIAVLIQKSKVKNGF